MPSLNLQIVDTNRFNNLSVRDLLQARAYYHVFLTTKRNVVGTAIGRYLIRDFKFPANKPKPPRTLSNSSVHANSWPCVLTFINQWQPEEELVGNKTNELIPKALYLPDGRAVPVCIVEAPRVLSDARLTSEAANRIYPSSVISGGYPLISRTQGQDHFASVGCLLSDGHKAYALTNRHVVGEAGTPVYARLGGGIDEIGKSSPKQLGKVQFGDVYPGWPNENLYLNADIGLVDVANVNQWKTEVYRIGELKEMLDLNVDTIDLNLINTDVRGYGAGSGEIAGRIAALFYRYRAVGGVEYVADFLIGPVPGGKKAAIAKGGSSVVQHGDSGTLLLADTTDGLRPFAVVWGTHAFHDGSANTQQGYALATGLSNMCRILDLDLVRGWNIDQPYTWGKTGHFKVGARACELVSDTGLAKLLMANQDNIGYDDTAMQNGDVIAGKFTHDFVPLADVADIIWRSTRKSDESNHFADIDETDRSVQGGKSLLELSLRNDKNIEIDFWLAFDKEMDVAKPIFHTNADGKKVLRPRLGALPFRVWQMYRQMILSLQAGKVDEFICAGGTMSHYVGDACQPLHISYLHHGRDASESAVHSDYETQLIDKKMPDLFLGVNAIKNKVKKGDLIDPDGKAAAKRVLKLMKETVDRLPPLEVVEIWDACRGRGKYDAMWKKLGPRTIKNMAAGSHALAILWQSAWVHGNGAAIAKGKLAKVPETDLQTLYNDRNFVSSFVLTDKRFKTALAK